MAALLIAALAAHSASAKGLSEYTAFDSTVDAADELIINDYDAGSPITRRIDASQLFAYPANTLDTEWDTQAEVEAIWGVTLLNTSTGYTQTAADAAFATAAQGALADSAVQPGDSHSPLSSGSGTLGTLAFPWGTIRAVDIYGSGRLSTDGYVDSPRYDFGGTTDASITRSGPGVIAVEGVDLLTANTTNVTAAGALMDSEVTNLADVKAFDPAAYQPADADLTTLAGNDGSNLTSVDADTLGGFAPAIYATAAQLADKADVTAMDAALAVRSYPLRSGIYSPASSEAISIPQQVATDLSTRDFSRGLGTIVLADWTPASRVILLSNAAGGNTGVRIVLETDGTLTVEFGDGTDWDASYTTTASLSAQLAYAPVNIQISADRSSSAQWYVNGVAFDTVSISAASAIDVDTVNPWLVLPSSEGWVYGQLYASTELITSDQAYQYYQLPDLLQRTTAGLIYASDFSSGAEGFNDVNTGGSVADGNVDAIDGDDDWLRDTPQNNAIVKGLTNTITIVSGRKYRLSVQLYTPPSSAIDSVRFRWTGATPDLIYSLTAGTRNVVDTTFTASATGPNFQIQPRSGGSYTFAGDLTDDLLYSRSITVIEQGIVEVIDCSTSGSTKPDLVASNDATLGSTSLDAL